MNNNRRRRFPRGNSSRRRDNRSQSPENSQRQDRSRHPPHLRGKAIGLWYAFKNREKYKTKNSEERKEERKKAFRSNTVGKVILSETRQNFIESCLKEVGLVGNTFIIDDGSYAHISDSTFKRDFLNTVRGNINDNLETPSKIENNPTLDQQFYDELMLKMRTDPKYKHMQQVREKLPSFQMREEILQLIRENQVIVLSGETGCGKTTQVAQFILDDYILNKKGSLCNIICTQPRRISAISIAERVAEERAERLGESVGYQIRLEKVMPREQGSILYCTTGVVLKTMEGDPCLGKVSHLILDEIHERDVVSDFIIALFKKIITKRKDLKLILMSATLNAEKFSSYYDNCPHINIPGFTYPVHEYYLEDVLERTGFIFDSNDKKWGRKGERKGFLSRNKREWLEFIEPYVKNLEVKNVYSRRVCEQLRNPESEKVNLDLIHALLVDICKNEPDPGAILVFLTGLAEISTLIKIMNGSGKFPNDRYIIIPLHSKLSSVHQKRIFEKPPPGIRKIVVATNIAETSITIDDVVFVIDCGKIKMSNYNIETDTQTLQPEWVSLANASQRRGRAGRVTEGVCFHLFTKIRRIALEDYQKPEILRKRLEDTILTLKVLKLGNAEPFLESLMDSPNPKAVEVSIRLLMRLNALDKEERLTPLGYHLAKLPMAPQMGKMILMGAIFSCLDPILSIAATLDFKDGFIVPLGKEKELDRMKLELSRGVYNDHLVFIEAMNCFENETNRRKFCQRYFLSWNTMDLLLNMKQQFMDYLYEMKFVPSNDPKCEMCNANSNNQSLIQAIICSGLYPNIAIMRRKNRFHYSLKTIDDLASVKFHPNSLLSRTSDYAGTNIVAYNLKVKSSCTYLFDASVISPLSLLFFGDNFGQDEGPDGCIVTIGNVTFKTNPRTAAIVKELRERLNWFLEYKVAHPGPVNWDSDEKEIKLLKAIMELITSEDKGELSDSEDDCLFVNETVDLNKRENQLDSDVKEIKQQIKEEIISCSSGDEEEGVVEMESESEDIKMESEEVKSENEVKMESEEIESKDDEVKMESKESEGEKVEIEHEVHIPESSNSLAFSEDKTNTIEVVGET